MKIDLKASLVVGLKAVVSTALGWLVARLAGVDIVLTPETVASLELGLVGLLTAVSNVVLNYVADQLRRIAFLRPIVDILWPNPTYGS